MKLGILRKSIVACKRYKATVLVCIPEGRMSKNMLGNFISHPKNSVTHSLDQVILPSKTSVIPSEKELF